jgi:transcriptional regulator with XRE-family HTH domain
MGTAGEWIRKLREQRGFSRENVEELTREFAQKTGNEHNWIRHGRLAYMERGEIVPDIYSIQSFAEIYQVPYERFLHAFGIGADEKPHLPRRVLGTIAGDLQLSTRQRRGISIPNIDKLLSEETKLITDPGEMAAVLQSVFGVKDEEEFTRVGLIGRRDSSMAPYVPPGAAVKIDTMQTEVESFGWKSLIERPIYFVWHDNGYSCRWCDQKGNKLILLPNPVSHESAMQLATPGEATVIGRITHIWSSLARTGTDR